MRKAFERLIIKNTASKKHIFGTKNTWEVWGLAVEVLGLSVVLLASLWQFAMTDWWENQLREWQNQIQEEINYTELWTLRDIASMNAETSQEKRFQTYVSIDERISESIEKAFKDRDARTKKMNGGQAELFNKVGISFILAGAGILILGKILSLTGAKKASYEKIGDNNP